MPINEEELPGRNRAAALNHGADHARQGMVSIKKGRGATRPIITTHP